MSLVEFLRVRKAALIVGMVLTVLVLANTASVLWQIHNHGFDSDDSHETAIVHSHRSGVHISIGGSDDASSDAPAAPAAPAPPAHVTHVRSLHDLNFAVPLGVLFGIAGFVAIGFATILGTSLNKENTLGGFAFTKPISRERLALTYFAVDAGGIVAMFLYVVLFEFIELAILGIGDRVVVDPNAFAVLAIGLGAAAMWYGLLQAVTSALRFPGGMFIGIGWGVFITLIPLSLFMGFGPVFHALVMALNYLNPLAYYSGLDMSGGAASTSSVLTLAEGARIAITWSVGIVACAVAVLGWKRVEV